MTEPTTGPGPVASDFVSLSYRMRSLLALRLGFAAVAFVAGVLDRGGPVRPGLVASSVLYVGLEVATEIVRRRGRGRRLAVLAFGVLLDGLYLTWITYLTGGFLSPFQALIYVHVIAVSLLASYRTGLKVAAWDTLLLLVIANAEASGALPEAHRLVGGLGSIATPTRAWAITIVTLWAVAIATAALSAVNERNLRRKRADLTALTRTVAALGASDSTSEIPEILLDGLHDTFDLRRSLVLASPMDDLVLLSSRGIQDGAMAGGMDEVVERALTTRSVQLIVGSILVGTPGSRPCCPMPTTSWSFRSSWPVGTGSVCWWSSQPNAVTASGHGRSSSSSSSRRTPPCVCITRGCSKTIGASSKRSGT